MLVRNPYIALGAAAVLGIGATLLASRWIQERVNAAQADAGQGLPVVVAAVEIPFGTRIRPEDLRAMTWPRASVPEGAYRDVGEVVGKFTNQKLLPGEIVLRQRAIAQGGGSSLSGLIEANKRAITVRVNDVIGVGGFLLPGNRVDVLATRMTDDRRATTRTLLQNLKVLAVDQTAQAEKDKPVVVRAVTLEMDPREGELLVQATEEGTVQLALRNPDDASIAQTQLAPPPVPAPPKVVTAAPPRAQAVPKATVTVIRQTQVGQAEVKS